MRTTERRCATLMTRLGIDEALIGDLVEQRAAGRSFLWFGSQAIFAVLRAMTTDVMAHPFRAMTAVVIGMLLRRLALAAWASNAASILGVQLVLFAVSLSTFAVAAFIGGVCSRPRAQLS
jgi:hypothetical protein